MYLLSAYACHYKESYNHHCYYRKRQAKMQKELEDAARDTRPVSPDRLSLKEVAGLPTAVPTKVSVTFVR